MKTIVQKVCVLTRDKVLPEEFFAWLKDTHDHERMHAWMYSLCHTDCFISYVLAFEKESRRYSCGNTLWVGKTSRFVMLASAALDIMCAFFTLDFQRLLGAVCILKDSFVYSFGKCWNEYVTWKDTMQQSKREQIEYLNCYIDDLKDFQESYFTIRDGRAFVTKEGFSLKFKEGGS